MIEIDYFLKLANEWTDKINLIVVANVDGVTSGFDDYSEFSVTSEFLSELELDELVQGLNSFGFQPKVYYDELDFMRDVLSNKCLSHNKDNIALNISQKGDKIGRKSLIPAFCDLNNITYINSNPYVVSLCRNKYHSGNILSYHNLPAPNSWLYTRDNAWIHGKKPEEGSKVIVKLNNESASIGIDENNIIQFSTENEYLIQQMCKHYRQEIIVQEFIEGYEIEVPFIYDSEPVVLPLMGIQIADMQFLGDKILTYNIRGTDSYQFYNYSTNNKIADSIVSMTKQTATILGIRGFGRIDYRVDINGELFVTDIATSPHIVKHSSFYNSFKQLGYSYPQMLGTLIGTALSKMKNVQS